LKKSASVQKRRMPQSVVTIFFIVHYRILFLWVISIQVHLLTKSDIITDCIHARGGSRCRERHLNHTLLAPVVIGEKNQCHDKTFMGTVLQRLASKKLDIAHACHATMVDVVV
jgi:hypothetical protein